MAQATSHLLPKQWLVFFSVSPIPQSSTITPGLSPCFSITQGRFWYWKALDSKLGKRKYNTVKWPRGKAIGYVNVTYKNSVPLSLLPCRKVNIQGESTGLECLRKKWLGIREVKKGERRGHRDHGWGSEPEVHSAGLVYDISVTHCMVSAEMTRAITSERRSRGLVQGLIRLVISNTGAWLLVSIDRNVIKVTLQENFQLKWVFSALKKQTGRKQTIRASSPLQYTSLSTQSPRV